MRKSLAVILFIAVLFNCFIDHADAQKLYIRHIDTGAARDLTSYVLRIERR